MTTIDFACFIQNWLSPLKDILALFVATCALYVSWRATKLGPINNLHSERIKLTAKALDSTNSYGWKLGAFVGKPDREAFSNGELHSGQPEEIVSLYHQANADLTSLELILPDSFLPQLKELKVLLEDVERSFQSGKFSELNAQFHKYREKVDVIRRRLRVFLVPVR